MLKQSFLAVTRLQLLLWYNTSPIRHCPNIQTFPWCFGSVLSCFSVVSVEFAHKRSKEPTTCASSAIFSFNNLQTKTRFLVKFYMRAAVLMYFISDGSFQCKPMSTSKRKSISGVLKPCIVDLSCQVFGKRQDFR